MIFISCESRITDEARHQCRFNYWPWIISPPQVKVPHHLLYQKTRDIHPLLAQCWSSVYDAGSTLSQQWLNVSCLLLYHGEGSHPLQCEKCPEQAHWSGEKWASSVASCHPFVQFKSSLTFLTWKVSFTMISHYKSEPCCNNIVRFT